MTTSVKAIYEDGVLKPKSPLELEEHSVEIATAHDLLLDRLLDAIDRDHLVTDQEGGENRHIWCNGGVGSVDVSTSLSERLEPVPHDG